MICENELENIYDIYKYMIAGNATITITDLNNRDRFTYKIRKDAEFDYGVRVWYVSLLVQSDKYNYIGILKKSEFIRTAGSKVSDESKSFMLFDWLVLQILRGNELPDNIRVYHAGVCGRCGRELTTPESIKLGLGPVCAELD